MSLADSICRHPDVTLESGLVRHTYVDLFSRYKLKYESLFEITIQNKIHGFVPYAQYKVNPYTATNEHGQTETARPCSLVAVPTKNHAMKKINTLVVGQGIAGTLVAYQLYLHEIPFIVIDPACTNTSSRIAAGMFTPITGKRKTIHPDVLRQIPFAIKMYKEIELLLGVTVLHLNNIYQVYNSETERKELIAKSANIDFAKFIDINPIVLPHIRQADGAFEIMHSGWVDCRLLINSFARWLQHKDALINEMFVYQDLETGNEVMQYHGLEFSNIIFCEGYQAINNPFFKSEKIIPCKGDMLTIQYDRLATNRIIKKNGMYLIPAGNHLFRAGATYQWNNDNSEPDEAGKKLLEQQLNDMLENKFTIVDHKAAIRPTTQNREVIARQHPEHAGMFMLNGLGTKGVLQGPWRAREMVEWLNGWSLMVDG